MMKISWLMHRLRQEFLLRRLPHGLFSLRYLLPSTDERVKRHRLLWLMSRGHQPWTLWLMLESWLWLKWLSYGAWRSTWLAVRHYGPALQQSTGLSCYQQTRHVLALALGWCVPAAYWYRYHLYRSPDTALDYIYDHETSSYHRWCSRHLGFTSESLSLLQDKWRLTYVLAERGIPMAPILAKVPRHATTPLSPWLLQQPHLFCKMRSGHQGIAAFSACSHDGQMHGRRLDGQFLHDQEAIEAAWRHLLKRDDALIQPYLLNHIQLAHLSPSHEAISLRYITQWSGDHACYLSAQLEIPAGQDDFSKLSIDVILPLSALGEILPFPADRLLSREIAAHQRIAIPSQDPITLPFWDIIINQSAMTHDHFPDIHAIAWDWVITPDGPLLLEGNAGWGLELLQRLDGPRLNKLS